MNFKVLVTPRTFGKGNRLPITMLEEAGCELTFNPHDRPFTAAELIPLLRETDGIIVGLDPLDAAVLRHAGRLKVISKYGVGLNNIDLELAAEKGILVTYTPGTNSSAVAELALGLILDVARNIAAADREIRRGGWGKYSGLELRGKTLGILGTGQIGKELAARVRGFAMPLLCYDINRDEAWAEQTGAKYLPLKEVLTAADIVSIHLPLNEATRHLIGAPELALLKPAAILINTARGGIVDEKALYEALANQRLHGAGIDVFEEEPPRHSPLTELRNVVLTSHSGSHTAEAVLAMGKMAAQNLIQGLQGKAPLHTVGAKR